MCNPLLQFKEPVIVIVAEECIISWMALLVIMVSLCMGIVTMQLLLEHWNSNYHKKSCIVCVVQNCFVNKILTCIASTASVWAVFFVHLCVHASVCMSVSLCLCIYVCISVHDVSLCMYVCVSCVCVYACVCLCLCLSVCLYLCLCIHVCMCMYIYVTHSYMHVVCV